MARSHDANSALPGVLERSRPDNQREWCRRSRRPTGGSRGRGSQRAPGQHAASRHAPGLHDQRAAAADGLLSEPPAATAGGWPVPWHARGQPDAPAAPTHGVKKHIFSSFCAAADGVPESWVLLLFSFPASAQLESRVHLIPVHPC